MKRILFFLLFLVQLTTVYAEWPPITYQYQFTDGDSGTYYFKHSEIVTE